MPEAPAPRSIDASDRNPAVDEAAIEAILDRTLEPRTASMLYDKMGELGLQATSLLLDIGCRDARHTCELVARFGCRAVGIDPVDEYIQQAHRRIATQHLAERITVIKGRMESLPAQPHRFDYIWCRDVLNYVPELRLALRECARVLKPNGSMLIYQTFATDLLEPPEAARLYPPLAVVPANMSAAYFEEVSRRNGFQVIKKEIIGSNVEQ